MRYFIITALFLLFSPVLFGQSFQQNIPANAHALPDYFVLKGSLDTIFVVNRKQYSLSNGQFTKVEITTKQGKKKFSKKELAEIQAYRMYDKAALIHVFEGDRKEHLAVLTHGPVLLLVRPVYIDVETDEEIMKVRTDNYYWWQAGKMIEVDAASITKVVQLLSFQCNVAAESPSSSNKASLIELTNQLNQYCSSQIVW